eukprot:scaffold92594_cov45-Cyclotella_meneghiniana.AAC.2
MLRCERCVYAKPNSYPPMTQNWVVVTTLEPMCQSQPCVTIHHTIDETLAGGQNRNWYHPVTQKPVCGDGMPIDKARRACTCALHSI